MSEITNAQLDAIDKQRMSMYADDANLGAMDPDSLSVMIDGVYQPVTIDQIPGIVKEWQEGYNIMVRATLLDVSPAFIIGTLFSGQLFSKTATSGDIFGGFGPRKIDMRAQAVELRLHEYGVANTTRTTDWIFWKAKAKFKSEFAYGATRVKKLAVEFTIYPDTDKELDFQYGGYGDYTAMTSEAVPVGVWISAGKIAQTPGIHLAALSLAAGQLEDMQVFAAYSTAGDVTAAINNGSNITSGATTIAYDTLAGGTIVAGDYIKIDNEYMWVVSKTDTEYTVKRAVWGSTAASHLDNAVITVQKNVSIVRVTNWATMASSVTADVIVGNTFGGTGTAAIARISHVSSGSSNVTATVNTKASPNLVVTAA